MVPSRSMAAGAESAQMEGRYEVLEKIAAGGMATVHLGRALGESGQPARFIAVKRMHRQYAGDPDFRSMFLDEAQLCARIQHENVVPTLDVVDAGGELLLILELVEGESLSRLAKQVSARGLRIPLAVSAAIVIDLLRGLHAAHEALSETGEPLQMVHRDVSPHNVIVGSDGVSRVLDFGVAKARGRMQQTQHGQIKGKIAYMSPEQARGKAVDRRSDVFAAGIVLWEVLTGKRLFEGDNEASVLTKLLTETPPLLSSHDPTLAAYDPIAMRALSTNPDERFASALEMALALEAALPAAARFEVSTWVRSEARAALAERAAIIARHVASGPRSEEDDTPRSELEEASTDEGAKLPPQAPVVNAPVFTAPVAASLPESAFQTQKLTAEMLAEYRLPTRPDSDASAPQLGRFPFATGSGRPSDAPPAQSQVTALSLASGDLPLPLPQERVRQLFWIGIITAGSVALVVGALLVIVSKRPWSRSEGSHGPATAGIGSSRVAPPMLPSVAPPIDASTRPEILASSSSPSVPPSGASAEPAVPLPGAKTPSVGKPISTGSSTTKGSAVSKPPAPPSPKPSTAPLAKPGKPR